MALKKTHEQFCKEVYDLVGSEYLILGEYVKSSIKIKVRHNLCKHEYEITPNNFLRGKRCPLCFGTTKKTTYGFKKEILNKYKGEYIVLGEYTNDYTKIKVKHIVCGHEWEVTPTNILRGHGCPMCGKNIKKEHETFEKQLLKIHKGKIELLEQYKNARTPMKVKCLVDEYIWECTPSDLIRGRGCPRCAGNERYTTETYKKKIFDLYMNEYVVLDEYINSKTKILVKHTVCNHKWSVTPSSLIAGYGCPKCQESKGEKRIALWLRKNNINYNEQFKFVDCSYKKQLPFDFYLPILNTCIEYDGEGHYKPFRYNKDKRKNQERLEITQFRDRIKNDYCKQNNIKLIRIPYTKFNDIEQILKSVLI